MPSEPQLATELGISRGTLRESVRLLISNGLLDRRHGVGTFVARVPREMPSIDRGIDELFGATDAIAQLGYAPGVGTCEITLERAPNTVADELRLQKPARVCHIKRVRLANDRPVILCNDYLPADVLVERGIRVEEVRPQILARGGSLYEWLEQDIGRPIDTALASSSRAPWTWSQARHFCGYVRRTTAWMGRRFCTPTTSTTAMSCTSTLFGVGRGRRSDRRERGRFDLRQRAN